MIYTVSAIGVNFGLLIFCIRILSLLKVVSALKSSKSKPLLFMFNLPNYLWKWKIAKLQCDLSRTMYLKYWRIWIEINCIFQPFAGRLIHTEKLKLTTIYDRREKQVRPTAQESQSTFAYHFLVFHHCLSCEHLFDLHAICFFLSVDNIPHFSTRPNLLFWRPETIS